jgi:hypothetical protein
MSDLEKIGDSMGKLCKLFNDNIEMKDKEQFNNDFMKISIAFTLYYEGCKQTKECSYEVFKHIVDQVAKID